MSLKRFSLRIAGAVAVLSLLATRPVFAQSMTFEDAVGTPVFGGIYNMTSWYKGLIWAGFGVLKPAEYQFDPTGYKNLATKTSSSVVGFANAYVNESADPSLTPTVWIEAQQGQTFDFDNAWVAAAWRSNVLLKIIGFDANGQILKTTSFTISPNATFVTPGIKGAKRVAFVSTAGNATEGYPDNGTAFAVDNINTSTVPEPSTVALMAAGLAGLGFAARRRKR